MRLTVVIADVCHVVNAGGPVVYRRVTVDLTPEQARALSKDERWEQYGMTFIETDPPPSGEPGAGGEGRTP